MRHYVNIALLLCVIVLIISGLAEFFLPFSLLYARLHILSATLMIILVFGHLFDRLGYFKRIGQALSDANGFLNRRLVIGVFIAACGFVISGIWNFHPAKLIVSQSYESKHAAAIVRTSPLVGFNDATDLTKDIARVAPNEDDYALSMHVGLKPGLPVQPSIVIWAETTTGSMIETLYIDEKLAFSETPEWGGKPTPRNEIFPIWRNRYTLVSGVDPSGEYDSLTGTTPTHTFSLSDYLNVGNATKFLIFAEINVPFDTNEKYDDPHIGQPSILYSGLIRYDKDANYTLLKLTGHGANSQTSGAIKYDLDNHSSARELVELLLVNVQSVSEAQQ